MKSLIKRIVPLKIKKYILRFISMRNFCKLYGNVKTIVLRRLGAGNGMYSHLWVFFPWMSLAHERNLSVWVDMTDEENIYREYEGDNAWEYYYCQTSEKPLSDYMYCDEVDIPSGYHLDLNCLYADKKYARKSGNILKKYVKLNPEMQQKVDEQWNMIRNRAQGEKILGVKFRGTDYKPEYIPVDHPFQTTCDEMIAYVKKCMMAHGYQYIYLAVEETSSLKRFEEEFGQDKVLYYDCKLIDSYSQGTAAQQQAELVGRRKAGEDYIGTVECLARCNALIASCNSGTVLAIVMNAGEYEMVEIIDKGCK